MSDDDDSHALELHNLCLLNQLKHPYILELLAFYTYDKHRNFVFPSASGGDLGSLLKSHSRPVSLNNNFDFYRALGNLSSAIEKVHNYTISNNVDLKIIGLHRDIKPSNILVDHDRFILADFGFSRFKLSSQTSKTPFQIGGGDYLAPECEELEQAFEKGLIGRASDIWSFGCIILEVLVYMFEGAQGVQEFRTDRSFKTMGYRFSTFYYPGGCLNPEVPKRLDELQEASDSTGRSCVQLIRHALSIVENKRPRAAEVTKRLYGLAINQLLCDVTESFKKVAGLFKTLPALVEFERLKSWAHVLGFPDNDTEDVTSVHFELNFEKCAGILREMLQELKSLTGQADTGTYPLFLRVQGLNDELMELLPTDLRHRALSYLDVALLNKGEGSLPNKDDALLGQEELLPAGSKFQLLSFMKQITNLVGRQLEAESRGESVPARHDPRLAETDIQSLEPFGVHHLASIPKRTESKTKQVLVEWIRYGTHWEGPVLDEMVHRVGTISGYLRQMTADAHTLHILHCRGYFLSLGRQSFGLVYDLPFPFPQSAPDTKFTSLETLILQSQDTGKLPTLNDRLWLASNLASTLLDLHKATILHKSVSSSNVVIFSSTSNLTLTHFSLIGFNHARPSDPKAFTEGPPPGPNARRYHHPEYTMEAVRHGGRFRLEYEYYSLGLVLLEIGLWDTIVGIKATSAPEMRAKVLRSRVPLLAQSVGTTYREAVVACLTGEFSGAENKDEGRDVKLGFDAAVVTPLQSLRV